jgi:hypothetical protein
MLRGENFRQAHHPGQRLTANPLRSPTNPVRRVGNIQRSDSTAVSRRTWFMLVVDWVQT